MSDANLHGVLNMPPELWRDDEIDKLQRYHRYREASRRIEDLNRALIAITARCDGWETDCSSEEVSLIDEMIMLNAR